MVNLQKSKSFFFRIQYDTFNFMFFISYKAKMAILASEIHLSLVKLFYTQILVNSHIER